MKYLQKGLSRCQICDHWQFLEPIGTTKYDKEYKEKYDLYEETDLGHKINDFRWNFTQRNLFQNIKDYTRQIRILDWGCGNGSFVRNAPENIVAHGYDINPFTGYDGGDDSIRLYREPWSAITMWDVLEHMVDPYEFCRDAKVGFLFLTVPDTAGIRWSEGRGIEEWKHFRPDEHQHYFSVSSLSRMLARAGFHLIDLDRGEAKLRDAESPDSLVTVAAMKRW